MTLPSQLTLDINGHLHTLNLEPRTTLIKVLRDHLDLTGAKRACDRGDFGAYTVLVDEPVIYQILAPHPLLSQAVVQPTNHCARPIGPSRRRLGLALNRDAFP